MPNAKRLRENTENCAEMAEEAADAASRRRYQRMERTYLRLAETERSAILVSRRPCGSGSVHP